MRQPYAPFHFLRQSSAIVQHVPPYKTRQTSFTGGEERDWATWQAAETQRTEEEAEGARTDEAGGRRRWGGSKDEVKSEEMQ